MTTYIILLRGINVGGKNKIPMTELKSFLEEQGLTNVSSYIQSGNVIAQSSLSAKALTTKIERSLPKRFTLDSSVIKILALTHTQFQHIIDDKPDSFGDSPEEYYSDVIFLMDISTSQAMKIFSPKEGVDKIWPGREIVYSQRLSALRSKSRLSKIVASPLYKSMTIRSWNTIVKLSYILKTIETKTHS